MINLANESTLEKYLRKQHKDWSEEKIKAKAEKIWNKYVEDNRERLEKLEKLDKEAFEKSIESELLNFLIDNDIYQSFFVIEFNKRRRNYLWDEHEEKMKLNFRSALIQLESMLVTYPDIFCENQMNGWDKNTCGYRGVGFNSGYVSKVVSKAASVKGVKTVSDHFIGASLCGEIVRNAFIENNYDIDYMVNKWLYKHLFLWSTVKLTAEEHKEENVVRNGHTLEQKINLDHYINVSELI